jgi:hypothetical protein
VAVLQHIVLVFVAAVGVKVVEAAEHSSHRHGQRQQQRTAATWIAAAAAMHRIYMDSSGGSKRHGRAKTNVSRDMWIGSPHTKCRL